MDFFRQLSGSDRIADRQKVVPSHFPTHSEQHEIASPENAKQGVQYQDASETSHIQ
jgi:hypothetical protein